MLKKMISGCAFLASVLLAQSALAGQPNVVILATGGTIAGSAASSTQLTDYKAGALTAEQLISAVPSLKDVAQLSAEQISSIASGNSQSRLIAPTTSVTGRCAPYLRTAY